MHSCLVYPLPTPSSSTSTSTSQSVTSIINNHANTHNHLSMIDKEEEEDSENSPSSPFTPVHRALPLESNRSSTTLQWKERLHEWSTHEEIDDDDTSCNYSNKRMKRNSGSRGELTHLAKYNMSEEHIIQIAHVKLPFFRSIRELKASGYEFRKGLTRKSHVAFDKLFKVTKRTKGVEELAQQPQKPYVNFIFQIVFHSHCPIILCLYLERLNHAVLQRHFADGRVRNNPIPTTSFPTLSTDFTTQALRRSCMSDLSNLPSRG